MAGSHSQRRNELFPSMRRFLVKQLRAQMVLQSDDVHVGHVFPYDGGKFWRVVSISGDRDRASIEAEEVVRTGLARKGGTDSH
jgi:hypothetical protein